MLRRISSLNVLIGCLALAAAVGYPFWYQAQTLQVAREAVTDAMTKILQAEILLRANSNEKFAYFPAAAPDKLPDALKLKDGTTLKDSIKDVAANFSYDVDWGHGDDQRALIVRAMTSDSGLQAGWPPLYYYYGPPQVPGDIDSFDPTKGIDEKVRGHPVGVLNLIVVGAHNFFGIADFLHL